jgi:hypothetical protein
MGIGGLISLGHQVMEGKENTSSGNCSLVGGENLLKNYTDTGGMIHRGCGWYLKQIVAAG